jgi:hypothetical protein
VPRLFEVGRDGDAGVGGRGAGKTWVGAYDLIRRSRPGCTYLIASWCDWPVNENDLTARHIWLVNRKDTLQAKLEGDPDYFDAKVAGWWCWGMACWIGGRFCSGEWSRTPRGGMGCWPCST